MENRFRSAGSNLRYVMAARNESAQALLDIRVYSLPEITPRKRCVAVASIYFRSAAPMRSESWSDSTGRR